MVNLSETYLEGKNKSFKNLNKCFVVVKVFSIIEETLARTLLSDEHNFSVSL